MSNFEETFEQDKKEHTIQSDGGFLKIKEGDNKFRVMAEPMICVERFGFGICYKGAPYCQQEALEKATDKKGNPARLAYKYLTWVLDRADDQMKLFKLPYNVTKTIVTLKKSDEYGFETFPMPYDVTLNAEGAGEKTVKYTLTGARKNTPLTDEEVAKLEKVHSIEDILDRMKQKKQNEDEGVVAGADDVEKIEYPTENDDGDKIDFEQ